MEEFRSTEPYPHAQEPLRVDFLSCVNDDKLYDECVAAIRALIIPPGFQIGTNQITGARSMAEGYNALMRGSTARYKIYLHQDVVILDRHFLSKILALFQSHPNVGLLGMVGGRRLPDSLVWWKAPELYGKVLEVRTEDQLIQFSDIDGPLKTVDFVDGLLMATQLDIPWNEDIPGFHFYDTSHSFDYLAAGYEVAVPRQEKPWVLHNCGTNFDDLAYARSRERFRDLYRVGDRFAI